MANNVYFREDPRQIANIASKLQVQRSSLSVSLSGMKSKVNGMRSYWKGGGADEYREKAAELDECGQEMVKRLDGFIRKLQEAGGIYKTAEDAAKTEAQGLPADGVFR